MKATLQHIKFLLLFSASLFLCLGKMQAQIDRTNYEIEARMHYGFTYFQNDEYHSALGRYSAHIPSYEFSFHRNTYGQHRWEVVHNYPSIGFTFYYSNFGNREHMDELGQVYALYPFINFPIIPDEDHKLGFKLGVGLSYLTNKFDPKENYHNYAIGSNVNAAINLSFEYRQRVTDLVQIAARPNPAVSTTNFILSYNRPGSECTFTIDVFDFAGRRLWSHTETGSSASGVYAIPWNLSTGSGGRLGSGVYLYRCTLQCGESKQVTESQKIIVLNNK